MVLDYNWNGRHSIGRSSSPLAACNAFLENGDRTALGWHHDKSRTPDYKTIFGPIPAHKGIVYDNDPITLLSASSRLTAAKKTPPSTLSDVRLYFEPLPIATTGELQRDLFNERQEYQKLWREIPYIVIENEKQSDRFTTLATKLLTHEGSLEAYALSPHAKLAPRTAALQKMRAMNHVGRKVQKRKASAKNKRLEWARKGKTSRQVIDLSMPESLVGGKVAQIYKKCQQVPCTNELYHVEFIPKPHHEELKRVFALVIKPVKEVTGFYHSDDGIGSIRCRDGRIFMFCSDQCAADSSTGTGVSEMFIEGAKGHPIILAVSRQDLKDVVIRNPHRYSQYVTIRTRTPFLLSGGVATTAKNNIGSRNIFLTIAHMRPFGGYVYEECLQLIRAAAWRCGYINTVDQCAIPQGLQFLKHSPFRTDSGYVPQLNLGTALRAIGQCDRDLPGRGDILARAQKFNSEVIKGFLHAGDNVVLNAYRSHIVPGTTTRYATRLLQEIDCGVHVDVHELSLRYHSTQRPCTPSDIVELADLIRTATPGETYNCRAARAILYKDYEIDM